MMGKVPLYLTEEHALRGRARPVLKGDPSTLVGVLY